MDPGGRFDVKDRLQFRKIASACAPSRIRTGAHGSGDGGRGRRRTHPDPGKHAPELPSGPVFSRHSLAVPGAPPSPGALPLVSAPRTGARPIWPGSILCYQVQLSPADLHEPPHRARQTLTKSESLRDRTGRSAVADQTAVTTARIRGRGQLTFPADVREALHAAEGDEVEFTRPPLIRWLLAVAVGHAAGARIVARSPLIRTRG